MNSDTTQNIQEGIQNLLKGTELDEDELKHVFHFEDNNFTIIAPIGGINEAEKQLKATLCILTTNDCLYGKSSIKSGDLREILKDLGIKSLTNLSTNLNKREFIIAKNGIYKLTHPGKKEGLSIIRQLYGYYESDELTGDDSISLHTFKSGKPYTSKKELSHNILVDLKGEVKFVDPYCGERTLDLLKSVKTNSIKVLTRINNLGRDKSQFINDLKDFKKENPGLNLEVRNYGGKDLHDRYIISADSLVLIGHSIKDLGNKESFAIKIDKKVNKTAYNDLNDTFDKRWNNSTPL